MKTRSHYPLTTNHYPLALSFLLPFVILGTIFALYGVYPFGDKHILKVDYFQQHFPLISNFWHKFWDGSISPWSWVSGGGHDYISLMAYFMSSPLNLLALIFPYALLREALLLIFLIKIGCMGLFTTIFLRHIFKPDPENKWSEIILPGFGTLYALCAFTLGYYWSSPTFDSLALLPLVALGVHKLFNEGKWQLYTVSVFLVLFTQFYYGSFVCIFAAMFFFSQCIINRLNRRDFFRKLGSITGWSVLAICMNAVFLLPSLSVIQGTAGDKEIIMENMTIHTSFFDVLGNFIAFTPPTFVNGLPNLYTGMIIIMLAGLFFYSKKISRREKIVFGVILLFLLLSCNIVILDYIMHGFHYTRGVPFRYSFLISFVLVIIAYRAFLLINKINSKELAAMGISCILILLMAILGSQKTNHIIGSAVFCVLYLLIFSIFFNKKAVNFKKYIMLALLLLVFVEIFITSWIAFDIVNFDKREEYTENQNQIQELLNIRSSTDIEFYRTDIDIHNTRNDPYLYNYNGISCFSSTLNADVSRFIIGLGIHGMVENNFFTYSETSPLTNAFLNMRYMISLEGSHKDNDIYWKNIAKSQNSFLLENKYYLPLGFMVKESLIHYKSDDKNPFLSQNNLFRLSTGLRDDLFRITELNLSNDSLQNNLNAVQSFTYRFTTPNDGMYYSYYEFYEKPEGKVNDRSITPIGIIEKNRNVTIPMPQRTSVFFIGCLNHELFEQGYSLLTRQPLVLTKFTDNEVCGTVKVLEDGLLYTSIPADKNWSVYVNGVKSEIIKIDNAMAAVRLSKGTHQIEFRYFNKSLAVGIVISLVSLAVFVVMALLKRGIRDRGSGNRGK